MLGGVEKVGKGERGRWDERIDGDEGELTLRIQHVLDRAGDAGGFAADDEFVAIGGDECDVGGDLWRGHCRVRWWGDVKGGQKARRGI